MGTFHFLIPGSGLPQVAGCCLLLILRCYVKYVSGSQPSFYEMAAHIARSIVGSFCTEASDWTGLGQDCPRAWPGLSLLQTQRFSLLAFFTSKTPPEGKDTPVEGQHQPQDRQHHCSSCHSTKGRAFSICMARFMPIHLSP